MKTKSFTLFLYFVVFIFLFLLELQVVGFTLREKIIITSSLDFSWFSDAIERYLHGYILGRDFVFTYGPLFQFIYSIPSLLFDVPSYISVSLSPLISFFLIFPLVVFIARYFFNNIFEQIAYILFLFLILGLLISNSTDTIKMITPMAYAVFVAQTFTGKNRYAKLLLVSFFPTFFGLYAYNLFVTCALIIAILGGFFLWRNKKIWKEYLLSIFLVFSFQIGFSLFLTHNLDYFYSAMDSVMNFRYVLNIGWAHDRNNVLFIFPIAILCSLWYCTKNKILPKDLLQKVYILSFTSLLQIMYGISRSDAGHLLWALYPSIICFFTILFVLSKYKRSVFLIGFMFYLLVPFKPILYNTLTPKNFLVVYNVIKEKPDFSEIYTFPNQYYYSETEINEIRSLIRKYKSNLFIYPYDSYLLNSEKTTFNSYSLGIYTYSNSFVEKEMVKRFSQNPPQFILLQIDTKGALNLDDIPNFTRNPLIAEWITKHYSLMKKDPKYLLLSFGKKKQINKSNCSAVWFTIDVKKKDTLLEKILSFAKPPLYYLNDIRLPNSPTTKQYLLFDNLYDSNQVATLFDNKKNTYKKLPLQAKSLSITRVDPFLGKKEFKKYAEKEFSFQCVNW